MRGAVDAIGDSQDDQAQFEKQARDEYADEESDDTGDKVDQTIRGR